MIRPTLLLLAALTGSATFGQEDAAEREPKVFVGSLPPISAEALERLRNQVANAPAEQYFHLQLSLADKIDVETLHTTALELGISRVLAYVRHGPFRNGQALGVVILGLGEFYSSATAVHHTRCRAVISVNSGVDTELRRRPIDAWVVDEIRVDASAHALRELLASSVFRSAAIMDGSEIRPGGIHKLEQYTADEVAKKIDIPGNTNVPEECRDQTTPVNAAVLVSQYDPSLNALPRLEDEDYRAYAFRVLGSLPQYSAVTMTLKLNFPATVEVLAAMVEQYGIDGMTAELVPARSDQKILASAELSIHGATLDSQIGRVRCQMRIGRARDVDGEWYADWITVSTSVDNTWAFLSYPRFSQAQITGKFPLEDLQRVRAYHERQAGKAFTMPRSIAIPEGCEPYYRH